MRKSFFVMEKDKNKREKFYDYIVEKYNPKISYPYSKDYFVNSKFPFVIDFKENKFWICDSITCCACASQSGVILTIAEFKKNIKNVQI